MTESFDETFQAYQEFRKFRELYKNQISQKSETKLNSEEDEVEVDKENCQSFANLKQSQKKLKGEKVSVSQKQRFLKTQASEKKRENFLKDIRAAAADRTSDFHKKPNLEKRETLAPIKDKTSESKMHLLKEEDKAPKPWMSFDQQLA